VTHLSIIKYIYETWHLKCEDGVGDIDKGGGLQRKGRRNLMNKTFNFVFYRWIFVVVLTIARI
jgi:hypothetical protein